MSYFPHAYKKVFIGGTFVTSGKTQDLDAGEFGFFEPNTWTALSVVGADAANQPRVVLALGSYNTIDKIGTHGGYKESVKSQIISARHVHRFWKVKGRPAQQQIIVLGWDGTNENTAPQFKCGQNYSLRIDLKGSPALRLLGRNLYHTFDYSTGCCADVETPVAVDPIVVLLELAKQINEDPIFSHFVSAEVVTTDGGSGSEVIDPDTYTPVTDPEDIEVVVGALRLTVAYVDTTFGNCSFDPLDHYEMEPLVVTSAQLVDESGDPCVNFKQLTFTETQAPRTADGTGEMILRDLILFNNYRQNPYHTDPRRREAEALDAVFTNVSRTGIYDTYYILHSVPRKSNPSGVYDDDLYLIQLHVPEDTNMTAFESWMTAYMDSANSGVALEDLSGVGADES
jgi:hypothetical protein